MSIFCRCLFVVTVVMGLAACSSPRKKETESPKLYERITQQQKAMMTYGSMTTAAKLGDKGGTGWFQRKKYHTDEYPTPKAFGGADKTFGGLKDYKTKGFSQADKASRYGTQDSRYGKQENRMGSSSYATKDSRYSSMAARQDDQAFRGGDKSFKAGDFQPAKKSLKDNKRIFMESGQVEEERNANAYSESDVKRMLGR